MFCIYRKYKEKDQQRAEKEKYEKLQQLIITFIYIINVKINYQQHYYFKIIYKELFKFKIHFQ